MRQDGAPFEFGHLSFVIRTFTMRFVSKQQWQRHNLISAWRRVEGKSPARSAKDRIAAAPAGGSGARVTHALLAVICFVAGAAVMVIEISANRLLAPNFGNSLYTWTALIGVVLVALSGGAWLGGVLA